MERIKNTGLDDMMPSNVCKWTGIFSMPWWRLYQSTAKSNLTHLRLPFDTFEAGQCRLVALLLLPRMTRRGGRRSGAAVPVVGGGAKTGAGSVSIAVGAGGLGCRARAP